MAKPKSNIEIILKSLLGAWVTLVFGTSVLIYFFAPLPHRLYHQSPIINDFRNVWEIADDMGPIVKLSIIATFGLLASLSKSTISKNQPFFYLGNIVLSIITILLVLAFLPSDFSRGYGIGLTGTRFDSRMMPIYLSGAVFGGAVFTYLYTRLSKSN